MNTTILKKTTGKAREYAKWSCNLYVGCSNDCSYCYLKRGYIGENEPRLKSLLRNPQTVFLLFQSEMDAYVEELKRDGLFFTFSSDPMLHETIQLNMQCAAYAISKGIHVTILTKCAWWNDKNAFKFIVEHKEMFTVGFTLTGVDSMEPGASPNEERIALMKNLHEHGVSTFASIEPVIDFRRSYDMIAKSAPFCDEYGIGLRSGVNLMANYDLGHCKSFIQAVMELQKVYGFKIIWKKSIRDFVQK